MTRHRAKLTNIRDERKVQGRRNISQQSSKQLELQIPKSTKMSISIKNKAIDNIEKIAQRKKCMECERVGEMRGKGKDIEVKSQNKSYSRRCLTVIYPLSSNKLTSLAFYFKRNLDCILVGDDCIKLIPQ